MKAVCVVEGGSTLENDRGEEQKDKDVGFLKTN